MGKHEKTCVNHTEVDDDSDCLESIHKIGEVCYGKESISVDEFPKKAEKIVKNTLKHNPWLLSDY